MERTITAILTNSNDKKVFNSNATTLGELKAEMTAQGIDYHNMDFMEGLTHTQMIDDAAILPSNVNYKGQVTNNLVFMLSTTNKRITSGAYTRQECFAKVKEMNLQDTVKETTSKNFTQVSTDTLNEIIEKAEKKNEVPADRKGLFEYIKKHNLQNKIQEECGNNFTRVSTETLYAICKGCKCSNKAAASKVEPKKAEKPVKKEVKSPYSNKELDEIIAGLKR